MSPPPQAAPPEQKQGDSQNVSNTEIKIDVATAPKLNGTDFHRAADAAMHARKNTGNLSGEYNKLHNHNVDPLGALKTVADDLYGKILKDLENKKFPANGVIDPAAKPPMTVAQAAENMVIDRMMQHIHGKHHTDFKSPTGIDVEKALRAMLDAHRAIVAPEVPAPGSKPVADALPAAPINTSTKIPELTPAPKTTPTNDSGIKSSDDLMKFLTGTGEVMTPGGTQILHAGLRNLVEGSGDMSPKEKQKAQQLLDKAWLSWVAQYKSEAVYKIQAENASRMHGTEPMSYEEMKAFNKSDAVGTFKDELRDLKKRTTQAVQLSNPADLTLPSYSIYKIGL